MITIRSKKTKLQSRVTEAQWEQMKGRGDARKFEVVSTVPTPEDKKTDMPDDLQAVNYEQIVKDATRAFKKKDFVRSRDLYAQAASIKSTKLITDKLAEIDALTSDADDVAE